LARAQDGGPAPSPRRPCATYLVVGGMAIYRDNSLQAENFDVNGQYASSKRSGDGIKACGEDDKRDVIGHVPRIPLAERQANTVGGDPPRKVLEPSLQAWTASRGGPLACMPRNIAPSECDDRGELSVRSMASSSRLSRSSRSSRQRAMSTEERELRDADAARRGLKAQVQRNERTSHRAIHYPDAVFGNGGATQRSLALTMPQEFNLSCPATSRRREASMLSVGSSISDSEGPGSHVGSSRWWGPTGAWEPQLTVPKGPNLRTAQRARSRSSSVSSQCSMLGDVCATPDRRSTQSLGTPSRGRDETPRCLGLHPRERAAMDLHRVRIPAARNPSASPLRRAPESPLIRARSVCAGTPRLNWSVGSGIEPTCPARLTELAQRTPSCGLSSEELELQRIKRERQAIQDLMRLNERTCREALSSSFSILGESSLQRADLTIPEGPCLHTAARARSRSASRRGSVSGTPERRMISQHPFVREQTAIKKHVNSIAAVGSQVTHHASAAKSLQADGPPSRAADLDEWIQEATTEEDRAARVRLVAKVGKSQATTSVEAKSCPFQQEPLDGDSETQPALSSSAGERLQQEHSTRPAPRCSSAEVDKRGQSARPDFESHAVEEASVGGAFVRPVSERRRKVTMRTTGEHPRLALGGQKASSPTRERAPLQLGPPTRRKVSPKAAGGGNTGSRSVPPTTTRAVAAPTTPRATAAPTTPRATAAPTMPHRARVTSGQQAPSGFGSRTARPCLL